MTVAAINDDVLEEGSTDMIFWAHEIAGVREIDNVIEVAEELEFEAMLYWLRKIREAKYLTLKENNPHLHFQDNTQRIDELHAEAYYFFLGYRKRCEEEGMEADNDY